ncbi:hypothetical protein CBR_g51669 [Chara braunii]|uniref:Uncharacterized protein n=1 Tax=Chara braunii TaxID=69332 RepID=A0A388M8X1_CHABU|nr:hypothetical protein CBR_g51669 [Chara braunii]|eukprot:GBG91011.1 hypothetical protein CBR_g51669 [Chara braunii]
MNMPAADSMLKSPEAEDAGADNIDSAAAAAAATPVEAASKADAHQRAPVESSDGNHRGENPCAENDSPPIEGGGADDRACVAKGVQCGDDRTAGDGDKHELSSNTEKKTTSDGGSALKERSTDTSMKSDPTPEKQQFAGNEGGRHGERRSKIEE